ncbi:MAG: integrase, partial [Verrucomicrobia bacterium]|nr:integrase [Verrucomicrobiota bacterium]
MPLELRKGRDGKLIPKWYGRYEVRGKRHVVTLCKMKGTPPESMSIKDSGDDAFELSRAEAQSALKATIETARRPHDAAHLVERIYELKTGARMKTVPLEGLADEWEHVPRRRKPNARYAKQCRAVLDRFVVFMRENYPRATELPAVSREMALAFLEAEDERGVANKTWNDTLKLLRAACKYLLPNGAINPFVGIPTRDTETMFRKPFSPAELKLILDEARKDDFIRPVIITGVCTAMRRGDCCMLKWDDVDQKNGFITVKTSKTGET